MSYSQYLPLYTSMECIRESDEWFSDEPYAIFVGVDWTNGITNPRWFVRNTHVYSDVDTGDKRGTNTGWDNKNLTKSGKYERIDPGKHFVLVQAMEHDCSSSWGIRRILWTVMEASVEKLLIISQGNRTTMIENTKKLISLVINKARYIPGSIITSAFRKNLKEAIKISDADSFSEFLDAVEAGIKVVIAVFTGLLTLVNPDDVVGSPQVLNISGDDRQYLTFSNSGKYQYKFSIHRK